MSKKGELIRRLKSKPKDFDIHELETLMGLCGCEKSNAGKTSGSAIKFSYVSGDMRRVFSVHKPHPEKTLKPYAVNGAIKFLTDIGAI